MGSAISAAACTMRHTIVTVLRILAQPIQFVWCLQCVGYGDMVPKSTAGKLAAGSAAVVGVLVCLAACFTRVMRPHSPNARHVHEQIIAVPISVISRAFNIQVHWHA